MGRFLNRFFARLNTRFPSLFDRAVKKPEVMTFTDVPWTPFTKPLNKARVALVTTAGVHLLGQTPFDMLDRDGDASYRELPSVTPLGDYTITHDYYDHTDAEKDINIVFPIERLMELKDAGFIGSVAEVNYGFMGHIDGSHVETLMKKTAPQVGASLKAKGVDAVILTPG
ncbi:MAG: hypothetical protein HY884_07475 [Deltaproteobacteria bacterium]|nr:hypothetical protein [Deltaproteobacteria bacterium]